MKTHSEKTYPCEVRQGTRREAVLFSVGANASHGLRRTNADKERAVKVLLSDDEWKEWGDREIASRCGVTHPFVGQIRKGLSGNGFQMASRKVQRGGTTYTQKPKEPALVIKIPNTPEMPSIPMVSIPEILPHSYPHDGPVPVHIEDLISDVEDEPLSIPLQMLIDAIDEAIDFIEKSAKREGISSEKFRDYPTF
jgi:hypothetical protein